jgi:peptide/nickel transport system ATP-binding protein
MDPRMRVGTILREPMVIQRDGGRAEQRRIATILDEVGLPASAAERYPHEFSGEQRQRLGLARALMLRPSMIVADEPVSALDVSIQARILNLMKDLQREHGLTYLFISHDLSVIRYMADTIGVMYLGKPVRPGGAPAPGVHRVRPPGRLPLPPVGARGGGGGGSHHHSFGLTNNQVTSRTRHASIRP